MNPSRLRSSFLIGANVAQSSVLVRIYDVERWGKDGGKMSALQRVLLSPFANSMAERNCHADVFGSLGKAIGQILFALYKNAKDQLEAKIL